MWDVLLQNLPIVILIIVAIIICGADLIKAINVWREERKRRINQQVEERQQELDILAEFNRLHERFDAIDARLTELESRMTLAEQKLQDLTESDMHDIKAWIVEQYHKFYIHQGWIDAFSAETIDRRYSDYKKEGGNSYIKNLIDQLHTLSMDPEQNRNKDIKEKK
jgi:hypothetical protein